MRYGEMTAFEERPHSPYYGSRRRDAAVRRAARRVRAVDRRHRARARARVRGPRRAALDRRVRRPPRQRLRRVPAPQRGDRAREPVLEGLAGTRSRTATARCRASRGRPASCRATPTTPRCAAPAWPVLVWRDPAFADDLERQAADLKRRFNRDFWVEDGEYFAVALDADGRQVDSLTSNIGHLLWSGIVDKVEGQGRRAPPHGRAAVLRLGGAHPGRGRRPLQPDRLPRRHRSGRSTTRSSPGGCAATASRTKRRASPPASSTPPQFFEGRLPEAFGGYPREMTKYPVQYPTACSPQAWSTGAPLLLLAHDARAWNRSASTSSSTPRCPARSVASSCSTSPAAGAASTPSAAAASTPPLRHGDGEGVSHCPTARPA